jgi:hypothetical protein
MCARSSAGLSVCLRSKRSVVRIHSGVPHSKTVKTSSLYFFPCNFPSNFAYAERFLCERLWQPGPLRMRTAELIELAQ